ncbi:hypothetical protein AVEN_187997-1 [Araneus ventricosus]|uniref:Uncharacterized protein n=1 Tax=Araneus ventricosus TaxID=182803 RepID=A0A4Y2J3W9_ARAVE|nr:hypothetical protein AVEN_187997-1 [Araneus ventricosus]
MHIAAVPANSAEDLNQCQTVLLRTGKGLQMWAVGTLMAYPILEGIQGERNNSFYVSSERQYIRYKYTFIKRGGLLSECCTSPAKKNEQINLGRRPVVRNDLY